MAAADGDSKRLVACLTRDLGCNAEPIDSLCTGAEKADDEGINTRARNRARAHLIIYVPEQTEIRVSNSLDSEFSKSVN